MTGAAERLSLAAAPTFAVMALLSAVFDTATAPSLCSAVHTSWMPTGMTPMYVLMSMFHSVAWLKRPAGRRSSGPG